MKRFFAILALLLACLSLWAQKDEVTLVVSGDGKDKAEATSVALRSAIEQTYGTFVSANTSIINDDVVKDEIVSVSSGNIKSYKEIDYVSLPDGRSSITLQATVSIGKLVSYAKSHGSSAELSGAVFMQDFKMKELNKKNEKAALMHMSQKVEPILADAYNYELEIFDPFINKESNDVNYSNKFIVPIKIVMKETKSFDNFLDVWQSTLSSLSLSSDEVKDWESRGLKTYKFHDDVGGHYCFRNDVSEFIWDFGRLICDARLAFTIRVLYSDGGSKDFNITDFATLRLKGTIDFVWKKNEDNAGCFVSARTDSIKPFPFFYGTWEQCYSYPIITPSYANFNRFVYGGEGKYSSNTSKTHYLVRDAIRPDYYNCLCLYVVLGESEMNKLRGIEVLPNKDLYYSLVYATTGRKPKVPAKSVSNSATNSPKTTINPGFKLDPLPESYEPGEYYETDESYEEAVPFQLVPKKPTFDAGDGKSFADWVNSKIKESGVSAGRKMVRVSYTISKTGRVRDVKIMRSSGIPEIDALVVDIFKASPRWTPGRSGDRNCTTQVNTYVEL